MLPCQVGFWNLNLFFYYILIHHFLHFILNVSIELFSHCRGMVPLRIQNLFASYCRAKVLNSLKGEKYILQRLRVKSLLECYLIISNHFIKTLKHTCSTDLPCLTLSKEVGHLVKKCIWSIHKSNLDLPQQSLLGTLDVLIHGSNSRAV